CGGCNYVESLLSIRLFAYYYLWFFFFFQAEDGIRDLIVTGVQTCALPICHRQYDGGEDPAGGGQRSGPDSDLERVEQRVMAPLRSEERRVGKECRSRWAAYQ